MTVMKPSISSGISLKHCFKTAASVAVAMLMIFGSGGGDLWAQNSSSPSLVRAAPTVNFTQLNVSLGSVVQVGQASAASTANKKAEGATSETDPNQEELPLGAALGDWQRQAMVSYSFNIDELSDPFLPIKEVRGTVETLPAIKDPLLDQPPHCRVELSQLKLVAITILSSRNGTGLASFEGTDGVSYILKLGDRIGRNKGRITKIEPAKVTVEEIFEQKTGKKSEARTTEMRLHTPGSSAGLTRTTAQ